PVSLLHPTDELEPSPSGRRSQSPPIVGVGAGVAAEPLIGLVGPDLRCGSLAGDEDDLAGPDAPVGAGLLRVEVADLDQALHVGDGRPDDFGGAGDGDVGLGCRCLGHGESKMAVATDTLRVWAVPAFIQPPGVDSEESYFSFLAF